MGARCRLRGGWAWAAAAAWLGLGDVPAGAAESSPCLAWPGEPVPLPQINDADPMRARWAALRLTELAREAGRAETTAHVQSQRLWRRVLCLDPRHAGALRGFTRSVRIHRPGVRWGKIRAASSAGTWDRFDEEIRVARPRPRPRPDPPAVARARELVAAGEESLQGARFEEALGRALAARRELEAAAPTSASRSLALRVELMAATAQVALGDEAGARKSLGRALALDPELSLNPREVSPKVLSALEAARAEATP